MLGNRVRGSSPRWIFGVEIGASGSPTYAPLSPEEASGRYVSRAVARANAYAEAGDSAGLGLAYARRHAVEER